MSHPPNTPILVGVGQFTERIGTKTFAARSASDLAAEAARRAFDDALSLEQLAPFVDAIATTRTFEDSTPKRAQPFGKSNNFPRSVARRLDIAPRLAVWERGGGNTPQQLVNEFMGRLAKGEFRVVLIAGGENISTARWLQSSGGTADWSETVEGAVENRAIGARGFANRYLANHGLVGTPPVYGICENARRSRLGRTAAQYAADMGELFAPLTAVAAANPYSSFAVSASKPRDLVAVDERNRMIADPYPQRLVARDQVNQAAALVLTTIEFASEIGIAQNRWIYLHGHADLVEREFLDRADLGQYPAAVAASKSALEQTGISVADVSFFDFYSCYPVAVSSVAVDGLGVAPDDPRGLTVTGGLPYFGGPGNNYSMHAICTMVEKLREQPAAYGFIGANGGYLSKYSVGIYSARAKAFAVPDDAILQQQIDGVSAPMLEERPSGPARIESYTIVYAKGAPSHATVVARTPSGSRFLATTQEGDAITLALCLEQEPIGRTIHVRATNRANLFAFDEARLADIAPPRHLGFRVAYEFVVVERRGHLLEVTINRPEVRNSLHPPAHDELDEVWDAFEADPDLWVAILTGAGTGAFSAGNDLRYTASGKPTWSPHSGFGGLTRRARTKPVIAAVNGYAMGGGTEMALACDIVVADERASFALSEVRVGLVAGAGGLVRLPRQIPKKVAVEHILTGRSMDARRALQLGLVNRVVAPGAALQGAREIANEILSVSPTSVRISMKMMAEADEFASEAAAAAHRSAVIGELYVSENFVEGPRAFIEKREPKWKNH